MSDFEDDDYTDSDSDSDSDAFDADDDEQPSGFGKWASCWMICSVG